MSSGVQFDQEECIWYKPVQSALKLTDVELESKLLGTDLLEKLKFLDPRKILEINCDDGHETNVAEMQAFTINSCKNLANMGLKKGDIVTFFCDVNSFITPICYGCFITGVIVNTFQITLENDDCDYVLNQIDATVIIYDDAYKNKLNASLAKVKGKRKLKYLISTNESSENSVKKTFFKEVLAKSELADFVPPDLGKPDEVIACIALTSGSSGHPKLYEISHSLFYDKVSDWWVNNEQDTVFFVGGALSWISQLVTLVHPVLLGIRRVYTANYLNAKCCTELIEKYGVTHYFSVTKLVTDLLDYCFKHDKTSSLRSIRKLMTGGAAVTDTLKIDGQKAIPNCDFLCGYGMTEVAGALATNEFCNSQGMALKEGMQLKILDVNQRAVKHNEKGEILLKCRVKFLKYYKNDQANSEAFSNGWLRTGDYGYVDENNLLYVLCRCKDIIYCHGKMIIPTHLENTINLHPLVLQAFIVGVANPLRQKDNSIAIFILLRASYVDSQSNKGQVEEYIKNNMNPSKIHGIYFVKSFKYLSSGKVDKQHLKFLVGSK